MPLTDATRNKRGAFHKINLAYEALTLFEHWGLKKADPFPYDRNIPDNYKHIPKYVLEVMFQAWVDNKLLPKVAPDLKQVDVTTDGESFNQEPDLSHLTSEELEAIEKIEQNARARQCSTPK